METKEEGIQIERNIYESEHDQLINYDGSNKKKYHHLGKKDFIEEAKRQVWLAGPLILVGLLTFSLHIISLMMVDHLGELPLSAASMATSFSYVTGFSVLSNTIWWPYTQRAMVLLMLISIPISVIWSYTETILVTLGHDHEIAAGAALYARFMIPSLFAYNLLQCLIRFFQTQNIVIPMMLTSGVTSLCHILICWLLVYKCGLGIKGAALANTISYWIIFLLLALYVKFSSSCSSTWTSSFSKASFQGIPALLRLAIPSAIMVCLEMWSFEMIVLLSGLLRNPALETSALSISLNTTSLVWVVPEGFSGAVSTARGCGWQKFGAYINLGSFYFVGLPIAILLAFSMNIGGKGLWLGILCAITLQAISFLAITMKTNWEEEAKKATERVFESKFPKEMVF